MARRFLQPIVDPETGEVIGIAPCVELAPGDIVRTKEQQAFFQKKKIQIPG